MEKSEQAKTYAEGKVQEALTAVVEKAYADGYDAGYKDAMAELKVEPDVEENGIKFVDFGLPSGTLWASDYLRDDEGKLVCLKYDEAAPLGLPTRTQLEELLRHCEVRLNTSAKKEPFDEVVYDIIGNGKKITLTSSSFWLLTRNSSTPNQNIKQAATNIQAEEFDKAREFRVRLVKNK